MTADRAALDLAAIIDRDAALHYCATCGNRVRNPDDPTDVHNRPAAECRPGGCLSPEDHHPFVEGEIPEYEQEARDRRDLITSHKALEEGLSAVSQEAQRVRFRLRAAEAVVEAARRLAPLDEDWAPGGEVRDALRAYDATVAGEGA